MQQLIYWVGTLGIAVLVLYAILFLVYRLLRPKESDPSTDLMPRLTPVPIATRSQPSWLHKLVVILFSVRTWEVEKNWHYQLNDETELVIPKGFRFDGASIPKIFWAFLSPVGLLLIPGLLHDYAYRYGQLWEVGPDGCPLPYRKGADRDYWDQLFQEVADKVNESILINVIARCALTVGAKGTWNRYRKEVSEPTVPELESCKR